MLAAMSQYMSRLRKLTVSMSYFSCSLVVGSHDQRAPFFAGAAKVTQEMSAVHVALSVHSNPYRTKQPPLNSMPCRRTQREKQREDVEHRRCLLLAHIHRSRRCSDWVSFVRVFCRVDNIVGRRALDPQRTPGLSLAVA